MNPLNLQDLQHIGIPTTCLEESLAFYDSLGFQRMEGSNSGESCAFVRLGHLVLELYREEETAGKSGAVDHIALSVADIEATWQQAHKMGLRIVEDEIQALPFWENGLRYFKIVGPNEEVLELMQLL